MDRIERVSKVLNYMASCKKPCGVSEISNKLKINKSSVSRILSSLNELQWVTQQPDDTYTLGIELLQLSLEVISDIGLKKVGLPLMHQLNIETGETTALFLRYGREDMCIDQSESQYPVKYVLPLGRKHPLWFGASGKTILANLTKTEIEEITRDLRKMGDLVMPSGRILSIEKLVEELEKIRLQGFAISVGERAAYTTGVASPIFGQQNLVIGSILLTGPLPRFNEDLAQKYSQSVIQTAHKISIGLGSTLENIK